ncbi:50S ribosomal protein L27-like [Penaeus monodon]|uniref:50S ribosomal protein L27-like n=1 Tax=Penaeus monodon TaxID=6687 RepID=UPI0018A7CA18|nr:50S ribosomal protein L27-like [Penaeus monodon]
MASCLVNQISKLAISSLSVVSRETGLLSNTTASSLTSIRHASKKAGGSTKNPKGRPKGKHRGIKKVDGHWVSSGTIIVRQLGLDYHPGLNVGIGRDRTLFAKEHGRVLMTTEKVNPDWNNKFVKRFYAELKDQPKIPIFKTYFHVIPEEQHRNFKLVDQI